MSNNAYDDFKQGIKNDVRDTGASVFFAGGIIFLYFLLGCIVIFCFKKSDWSESTRFIVGTTCAILLAILIFNPNARAFIIKAWLLIILGIIFLPIAFCLLYLIYHVITQPI